jgi:K+-transporting ATPase ATPase C chain
VKVFLQSLRIYLVLTLLTGVVYPLAMTGIARLIFPKQANGSLVIDQGKLVGSELLGQKFESPRYFWPRPSSADYATIPSGASNKGPTSADLKKAIEERRAKFGQEAPVDLLTASGSGLDGEISPEAAQWQVARVAAARGIAEGKVTALVTQNIQPRQFGFLGEPRVNVLRLNQQLDQEPISQKPAKPATSFEVPHLNPLPAGVVASAR